MEFIESNLLISILNLSEESVFLFCNTTVTYFERHCDSAKQVMLMLMCDCSCAFNEPREAFEVLHSQHLARQVGVKIVPKNQKSIEFILNLALILNEDYEFDDDGNND